MNEEEETLTISLACMAIMVIPNSEIATVLEVTEQEVIDLLPKLLELNGMEAIDYSCMSIH